MKARYSDRSPSTGAAFVRRGFVVAILFLAGCGSSGHEYAKVEGKVTLNNKPLAGVMVRFYPMSDRKEQLPIATGFTDQTGFYTLACRNNQPGAVVGSNRAVVSWPARDIREAGHNGQPLPAPSVPIPAHYATASDTPLTVEVKLGETNTIDLPLED